MSKKVNVVVTLALLVAFAAMPAFSGSREVFVSQDSTLNGVHVPKGSYKLSWKKNGSPDSVTVTLFKGIKVVAEAEGTMIENGNTREGDSLVYKLDDNGKREIVEVRFGGKTKAIAIRS